MAAYLADTSAWGIARRKAAPPELAKSFADLLAKGEIAICEPVQWELLHSSNNAADFASRREDLAALDLVPFDDADWKRALDICQVSPRRAGRFTAPRRCRT